MIQFTNEDPDFWIQLIGLNAGRPLREKIPNSIGVKTDPAYLVPDFLFYTVSSSLHPEPSDPLFQDLLFLTFLSATFSRF